MAFAQLLLWSLLSVKPCTQLPLLHVNSTLQARALCFGVSHTKLGTCCSPVLPLNPLILWLNALHEVLNPGSNPSGFDFHSRKEPRNSC